MRGVFVAGIGIAVFIEFLLLTKKNKSAADQILTLWMFLISVHLFLAYTIFTEDIYGFPYLLGLEHPLPLLQSVFLFYYTSFVTDRLPQKRSLLFLHLLPSAAIYIYLISFFLLPADQKIFVYRNHGLGYEMFMTLRWYAIVSSGLVYVAWSALLLRKHRLKIRDQFSDIEKLNLRWLQILTLGMGGIWFIVIFFGGDFIVLWGMVGFVFLIGFFGARQAAIFTSNEGSTQAEGEVESPPVSALEAGEEWTKKYQKSGLSEESALRLHKALMDLMANAALYKKADLSITEVASKLSVHPNYLSQVINQKEQKNFYDFVNTYRIEEFKRLISLQKNQQFTLLAIALECGFSAKSSFNRNFKKVTGQTPSEYASRLGSVIRG